ncbi:MAG: MerR family transcriptional regulator [Desulfatiglandales bacterium]
MSQDLTIQQVSHKLKVSRHTLRFWERELGGILVPLRTQGGQRRYTAEHLFIISEIRRLKGKGCSLEEIKGKLGKPLEVTRAGNPSTEERIAHLANGVAEVVRSTVYDYLQEFVAEENRENRVAVKAVRKALNGRFDKSR